MNKTSRACFNCLFGEDENIYLEPETTGLRNVFGGSGYLNEYKQTDDACDVCGSQGSLKRS